MLIRWFQYYWGFPWLILPAIEIQRTEITLCMFQLHWFWYPILVIIFCNANSFVFHMYCLTLRIGEIHYISSINQRLSNKKVVTAQRRVTKGKGFSPTKWTYQRWLCHSWYSTLHSWHIIQVRHPFTRPFLTQVLVKNMYEFCTVQRL